MKPAIPARPARPKASDSPENSQPAVPERPVHRAKVEGTSPPIPMKTKPIIPARPAKPITRDSAEHIPLTTVASNSSAKSVGSDQGSAVAAKPKPPVPSRPVGSKIAALQGGFMSDLNKRLQLGPQAPKKEEELLKEPELEKEKTPLVDARKGRARGPARRAPAKSPAPVAAPLVTEKSNTCSICLPSTLFEIDPEESLRVPSHEESKPVPETKPISETKEPPALATNIAGEDVYEPSEREPGIQLPAPSTVEEDHADKVLEASKETIPVAGDDDIEPSKPIKEPVVNDTLAPELANEEDLHASTTISNADDAEAMPEDVVE